MVSNNSKNIKKFNRNQSIVSQNFGYLNDDDENGDFGMFFLYRIFEFSIFIKTLNFPLFLKLKIHMLIYNKILTKNLENLFRKQSKHEIASSKFL